MTPAERAQRVLDESRGVRGQSGVSSKDVTFLESLQVRNPAALTEKQERWLADIERRCFDEGGDDE